MNIECKEVELLKNKLQKMENVFEFLRYISNYLLFNFSHKLSQD